MTLLTSSLLLRLALLCTLLQRPVLAASWLKKWSGESDDVSLVPLANSPDEHVFGVDVSFPMQYTAVRTAGMQEHKQSPVAAVGHHADDDDEASSSANAEERPFGDSKQKLYEDWLEGCRDHAANTSTPTNARTAPTVSIPVASACDQFEKDRIQRNLLQPRTMQNYTSTGYTKIHAPAAVFQRLRTYFDSHIVTTPTSNQHQYPPPEVWPVGNTHTNHWESPTHLIRSPSEQQQHAQPTTCDDPDLFHDVVEVARNVLEAWTGQNLVFASIYGIRIYKDGSIVAPHVARLPMVSSAIINIAQFRVEEPWPLEVIGHDQLAHNLTMDPGDMILYESHSVIHGRPYPLKGTFYASIVVHFEPRGHTKRHFESQTRALLNKQTNIPVVGNELKDEYKRAMEESKKVSPQTIKELPNYIQGTGKEKMWLQQYSYKETEKDTFEVTFLSKPLRNKMSVHHAAATGDLDVLKDMAEENPKILHEIDQNGWMPIHEAARNGKTATLRYLIKNGADVNAPTKDGATPLWWAEKFEKNHASVKLLKKAGAISVAPEH